MCAGVRANADEFSSNITAGLVRKAIINVEMNKNIILLISVVMLIATMISSALYILE
jgi:hypothetical protein